MLGRLQPPSAVSAGCVSGSSTLLDLENCAPVSMVMFSLLVFPPSPSPVMVGVVSCRRGLVIQVVLLLIVVRFGIVSSQHLPAEIDEDFLDVGCDVC